MSPVINNLNIGLKGYDILQATSDHKLTLHVKLKSKLNPKSCPHCAATKLYKKGKYQRQVKHLRCFDKPCQLVIHTHRWFCCSCNRSFIPRLPGITKWRRSSEPFRKYVYHQHQDGICAKSIALKQGIGQASVARIYAQFTHRKAAERLSLQCPQVIGIDEHTLHKGQKFSTTICDLKNRRIFDIRPGRSNPELAEYFQQLQGRERVKMVCIDLSSPYRKLIRQYFPNARIVADRFHVVRIIYHHFMQVARAIAPQLKSHRGGLAAMRKRPENRTHRQNEILLKLFSQYPSLELIHKQMHQLRRLMNHKTCNPDQCRRLAKVFTQHIHKLKYSDIKPMETLAKTLQEWLEPIGCMWRFTKNNGITEGFHRKMKLIQRRAYGFRNFENYRMRVIAQCG